MPLRLCLMALVSFCAAQVTWAQVIPSINAGDLMRNMGSLDQARQAQASRLAQDMYPPQWVIAPDDRTEVLIQSFEIRGNHRLGTEQLLAALQPYVRTRMALHETQRLVDAVAGQYRDAQIDAQVYLPKQQMQRQRLVIQVIERPQSGKP